MAKRGTAMGPIEGPWPLPDGWRWERLGDVCEPSQYGWTTKAASSGETKFLRTTDISSGRVDWSTVPYCAEAPSDLDRYRVKDGDILISRAGSVGKSFLIDSADDAVFASYLIRFRPLSVPRYIHHWLQTDTYWSMITENTAGIAIPNVNASKLSDLPVPMAPKDLRDSVVARIDELFTELDDGEAALARARDDLATWRKALLKAAVTGELTANWRAANGTTETGTDLLTRVLADRKVQWEAQSRNRRKKYTIPEGPVAKLDKAAPEGWAFATVEQLAFVENGQTPKGIDALVQSGGDVPWFKVSSMNLPGNTECLDNSTWWLSAESAADLGLRVHPAGSIVFPKRGGSIFTEKKRRLARPGAIDLNVMAVVPLTDTADYLWTFFRNLSLRAISDGSNVPQINYDDVAQLTTTVPPPNEAREIANRVNADLAVTAEAESEIDELQLAATTLRQSILAAAFRGELT